MTLPVDCSNCGDSNDTMTSMNALFHEDNEVLSPWADIKDDDVVAVEGVA